ncbi:MAG: ankyrin repeat domain-containing protein [Pseudomonadota bacterium]
MSGCVNKELIQLIARIIDLEQPLPALQREGDEKLADLYTKLEDLIQATPELLDTRLPFSIFTQSENLDAHFTIKKCFPLSFAQSLECANLENKLLELGSKKCTSLCSEVFVGKIKKINVASEQDNVLDEGVKSELIDLIERGADVNALSRQGYSALHLAVLYENYRLIQFLITELGADVDSRMDNEYEALTPLHCAIELKCIDIIQLLLERGAQPSILTRKGYTCEQLEYYDYLFDTSLTSFDISAEVIEIIELLRGDWSPERREQSIDLGTQSSHTYANPSIAEEEGRGWGMGAAREESRVDDAHFSNMMEAVGEWCCGCIIM